ncbi:uncharacterized protein LOC129569590 isoform X2 [Sitodiplosis mosellana]|uniref:uncharacterized protein LOC129569590 isoform X2 n=1 Tax=Sitodiplosis mosellana TaxID=263140 RepID=UPI0024437CA0|nr:uncharacterized protein LOC129569590 isoform X2 [Sitodiplosis mosellana]
MENRLVKIESEKWSSLKSLYAETPETILGLTTISNYIRWMQKDGLIDNLAIYSLNGDWSDGTFAVVDRYHVYFDCLSGSKEKLTKLLELLDFSSGFRIMHVRSKHYPIMLETIRRKQLQLEYDDPNLLYYLPKEKAMALNTQLPEGFYSRSLTDTDVEIANAQWPFNHSGSLFYLQRLARLNSNFKLDQSERCTHNPHIECVVSGRPW